MKLTKGEFLELIRNKDLTEEEVREAFDRMSPEDQEEIRKAMEEVVKVIKRVVDEVGKVVMDIFENIKSWVDNLPKEVKEELVKNGKSNTSELDEETTGDNSCNDTKHVW